MKANPEKWLELYGDMLYQYILPRVNDSVTAEDLLQETFLSAFKGLEGYKGEASEKNWLFAILKNKIKDYYRKKSATQTIITAADMNSDDAGWFNTEGRWAESKTPGAWDPSDNTVERKEIRQVINRCKDNLKEVQQQVFVLKYLEDVDSEEICKVLSISPSYYWVLLHRARLQMRECVEKNLFKS